MSTIDVALVTWPNHPARYAYFVATVHALKTKLRATGHKLRYVCSAESQRDPEHTWHGELLQKACRDYDVELSWRHGAANLGANMNAAMRLGRSELIFLVQDDWFLLEELNLKQGADHLQMNQQADLIRYSYPDTDEMRPKFGIHRRWRQIDLRGPWPYGDDPHLRRRDFMARHGWYLEGHGHGSASADLMKRLRSQDAHILAAEKSYFCHIGDVSAVLNEKRERRVTR